MPDPFFSQTVRTRSDGADERIHSKIVGSASTTLADPAAFQAKVDVDGLHVVIDNLPSSSPTVFNVSVPLANTEMSQALGSNVKKILLRARGASRTQFSFVSGESNINFITIPAGASYHVDQLNFSGTIYFQTSKGGEVVEILAWA